MPVNRRLPRHSPTTPPQRNNRLAAAIAHHGVPKYIIAAESRLSGPTISEIVAGRLVPSPEQASRLAKVLGCPIAVVMGEQ